ncbi:TolC family protein [Rhodoferax aquaticus]|uniref:TolC family protein n=1 Tax=Rhodoferax aquaticus TaxID=2527691 RepID=A0A515ELE9_9BURK|nr:TolC family protein [Rhodoferax aquaticus]QDL53449.1 TolC family protein [Rhodoferax aquaticus]
MSTPSLCGPRTHRHTLATALGAMVLSTWMGASSAHAQASAPDRGVRTLHAQVADKALSLQSLGANPHSPAVAVLLPHPAQESAHLKRLLAQVRQRPMDADTAVKLALLNNPTLQVEMGHAGLDLTDASPAHNPAKRQLQETVTVLSAQVLSAWVNAVAAQQTVQSLQEAKATAEAAGELSRRMTQVGNASKLAQAKQQAQVSEASIQLARAQMQAFAAKEALIQLLGLWGLDTQFELPTALPELPERPTELPNMEADVLNARVALNLQTAQWQQKRRTPQPASADALWDAMGDAASVRVAAVQARSEAREAYYRYRSTYDLAQHYQNEVLPLQQFIQDELVLRYNGMLVSVFESLAQSQTLSQTKASATDAQRDFWLAHIGLAALLRGVSAERGSLAEGNSANRTTTASGSGGH